MLAYQRDAGFTGRELDDIPESRTRLAMHVDLKAAEPLAFGPAVPPADLLREIGDIRAGGRGRPSPRADCGTGPGLTRVP